MKLMILMSWVYFPITIAAIVLLFVKTEAAFGVYLFILIPLIVTSVVQLDTIGGDFETRESWAAAGGVIGGVIGSVLQVLLVLWGLWVLRRRLIARPAAIFE